MSIGFWETLITQKVDGPTVTAATQQSLLDASAKYTMVANRLRIGDCLKIRAGGRISTAVTTPGASSWRLTAGANSATIIFDTLPLAGNTAVQTTIPWFLEAEGIVRATGASGNMFWNGLIASTAFIATVAPGTGPYTGVVTVPFNTAPVIGANWDMTTAQVLDLCYLNTTGTESVICHTFSLSLLTSSGF